MRRVEYWVNTHRFLLALLLITMEIFLLGFIANRPGGWIAIAGTFLLGYVTPGFLQWCRRLEIEARNERNPS